jgi:hypothetical protein
MAASRKPRNVTVKFPRNTIPAIAAGLDQIAKAGKPASVVMLSDLEGALRNALLDIRAYADDLLDRI